MARTNFVENCYKLEGYDRNSGVESDSEALFRKLATIRRGVLSCIEEEAFGFDNPEEQARYKAAYKDTWEEVLKLFDAYYEANRKCLEELNGFSDIILDIQMEEWSVSDYQSCADFLMDLEEVVDLNSVLRKRAERLWSK